MTLNFIAAVYNEENEIFDLIKHVEEYVDWLYFCDDGSTDHTALFLSGAYHDGGYAVKYKTIEHTGLPETVKNEALSMVPDGSWVLMLDADERFAPGVLESIKQWLTTMESLKYTHVYFQQLEIIDNIHVRTFQKAKLFRKESVHFPLDNIHMDDRFDGEGKYNPDWIVFHRKSTDKQIQREEEYLDTYRRLLDDGKIDEGRYEWLRNLHHYRR